MGWRKIEKTNGDFVRVYEPNPRTQMTASFFGVDELPPNAVHTDIADRPSAYHEYDGVAGKWALDLSAAKDRKKADLEAQAREDFFNVSPEKAALDTAIAGVDSATSKTQIDAVTL